MAVVTPAFLAACSSDDTPAVATTASEQADAAPTTAASSAQADTAPTTSEQVEQAPTATEQADAAPTDQAADGLVWSRVNLGFVSAYVLVRGNKAAIVDTGVAGSAGAIGASLQDLGLVYNDVEHVILTHNHGDHAGSIQEVLAEAVNATAYAGEADLGSIPGDISGLVGGEDIFGFEMLPTPGHTPGHMAAVDHQAGVLIAGDAIFSEAGGVVEGPARFFNDVPESRQSIKAMADLTFNTLLVGHGDPIDAGADSAVAALAASL